MTSIRHGSESYLLFACAATLLLDDEGQARMGLSEDLARASFLRHIRHAGWIVAVELADRRCCTASRSFIDVDVVVLALAAHVGKRRHVAQDGHLVEKFVCALFAKLTAAVRRHRRQLGGGRVERQAWKVPSELLAVVIQTSAVAKRQPGQRLLVGREGRTRKRPQVCRGVRSRQRRSHCIPLRMIRLSALYLRSTKSIAGSVRVQSEKPSRERRRLHEETQSVGRGKLVAAEGLGRRRAECHVAQIKVRPARTTSCANRSVVQRSNSRGWKLVRGRADGAGRGPRPTSVGNSENRVESTNVNIHSNASIESPEVIHLLQT